MQSFRISRAAQLLGVSDDTVRRWVDQGALPTTDAVPAEIPGDALAARAVQLAEEAQESNHALSSARNRFVGIVTRVQIDGVMAQVDLAGAVLPARYVRGRMATVAVNQFIFKQPVSLGDLLSFYARITRIGNTSIGVHVDVFAERNPANPQVVKVTEADLTYVAIDDKGQPRQVPR